MNFNIEPSFSNLSRKPISLSFSSRRLCTPNFASSLHIICARDEKNKGRKKYTHRARPSHHHETFIGRYWNSCSRDCCGGALTEVLGRGRKSLFKKGMGEIMPVGWLGRLVGGLTGLAGWCLYSEPLLDCTRTQKNLIFPLSLLFVSARRRGGIMWARWKKTYRADCCCCFCYCLLMPLSLLTFC